MAAEASIVNGGLVRSASESRTNSLSRASRHHDGPVVMQQSAQGSLLGRSGPNRQARPRVRPQNVGVPCGSAKTRNLGQSAEVGSSHIKICS